MNQRAVLAVVAIVVSLAAAEITLNMQRPAAVGAGPSSAPPPGQTVVVTPTPVATATPMATETAAPVATGAAAQTGAAVASPMAAATPLVLIVTARRAVRAGTVLTADGVERLFQLTPLAGAPPPGSLSSLADLALLVGPGGRKLAGTLLGGAPLLLPQIGYLDTGAGSAAARVAYNEVAVSLQAGGVAGLQGVVSPGDNVDIYAAGLAGSPRGRGAVVEGILVRYLATARVIALGPLDGQVTVAVARPLASVLMAAGEAQAHLHLVLRPLAGLRGVAR